MTEIITSARLITKYQKQFIQQLKFYCTEKIICTIGHQGYSDRSVVYYSKKYDFWFKSQLNENRYWNGFGFGKPRKEGSNSINVEINIPYKGINRAIGGVFGIDEKQNVLLLHRGKIGGGKIGIGKKLFFNKYRNEPVLAYDGEIETEFCLIGSLGTPYLPREVGNFISEVHRIKNLSAEQAYSFSALNDFSFTDEATGARKIERTGTTVINRTHGIVVNLLANVLKSKGREIGNDINRDLYIHEQGEIKKIFEVKRSSSTQDLYSAVGQLLIYSIPVKKPFDLILVLPDKLNKIVEKRLTEHGIQILYYDWNNGEPIFQGLDKIL